ncbi:hypothetical protein [Pseudoneobacillus sp. C159]
MNDSFWNRFFWGDAENHAVLPIQSEKNASIIRFLLTLSPGIPVNVQFGCMPPMSGIFQGLQDGNVIFSNLGVFKGLVRISPDTIHAVSISL